MTSDQLTSDQKTALIQFQLQTGHRWKSTLASCWESGNYPGGVDSEQQTMLQQVRNNIGPSGLVKLKF